MECSSILVSKNMLTSHLVHQDVLAIKVIGNLILLGTGGTLLIYCHGKISFRRQIFSGQKIHFIISGERHSSNFFVVGGKQIALCRLLNNEIEVVHTWKCDDWVLDVLETVSEELVLLTAHNQVQLFKCQEDHLSKKVSAPRDRCILYSGKLHAKSTGDLIVLAGTVYSEVIIWRPDLENMHLKPDILCRLIGHKGVIFSITIRETHDEGYIICTTSDDRSLRIWHVRGPWETAKVSESPPLYGHTARVWRSLQLDDCVVTIGEDSTACVWEYSGELRSRLHLHSGGGIRGLDFCGRTRRLLTGGEDGGALATPWSIFNEFSKKNAVCLPLEPKEIPRKVVFSECFGAVYLTDRGRLLSAEQVFASSELFKQCTDLCATSSGKLVVMCNRLSSVFFVCVDQLCSNAIGGEPCENMLWRDDYLLVFHKNRKLELKKLGGFHNDGIFSLDLIETFVLPAGKDLVPACFLYLAKDEKLLLGDRLGGLHLYHGSQSPVVSLKKLHSCLGISDIVWCGKRGIILTTGAGGWTRELKLTKEGGLELIRSLRIPMENGAQILETSVGSLVLGFHSTNLQIWSIDSRCLLGSYNCGGGHRSFSFRLRSRTLDFLFIKDKQVKTVTFDLNASAIIRNKCHSKIINSLQVVDFDVFVSGGEDNILRLWKIQNGDLRTLSIAEQHISSIRAISVIPFSSTERLIVSAGGREQIVLTGYNLESGEIRDITSHFPKNAPAEGRYMCLATNVLANGSVLILAGCSDCTIRMFFYDVSSGIEERGRLIYDCCILQVAILRTNETLYAVAFGTDGNATFWEISSATKEKLEIASPNAVVKLHASGINSFAFRLLPSGECLLVTGGDDNKLSAAVIRRDGSAWDLASVWSSSAVHSCQITGILLHEDLIMTTSIDQRCIISKLPTQYDDPALTILQEFISTVPDVHGVTALEINGCLYAALYGKGVEIVKVEL